MTVTNASFRQDFPAFANTTSYPDGMVTFWLTFATNLLTPAADRWGAMFDQGVELVMAHNLTIEYRSNTLASVGAPPGEATGMTNNKSVDKVSTGFDTASVAEEGGGHWNLTNYGSRFLRLARMIGAGPIQLGYGDTGNYSAASGAWPGPYWPFG